MAVLSDIQAIAFDAVGTLIHPEPSAAAVYERVGEHFGSRLTLAQIRARFASAFARQEAIDRAAGLKTDEARELQRWREIVAEVLDDVSDPESCFRELYEHFAQPASWRCAPETARLLEQLAGQGYDLALASNYDERLRRVLAGLPSLRHVGRVIISAEVGWRKPTPGFFAALCKALNSAPAQVVFIGDDRENDFKGATAAGLRALLFDPESKCQGPVPRISSLWELSSKLPLTPAMDR